VSLLRAGRKRPVPPPNRRAEQQKLERQRQRKVGEAIKLFERHPLYPAALVEIDDKERTFVDNRSDAQLVLQSEDRLSYLLQFLDARGEALLKVATDLEYQKAMVTLMSDTVNWAFRELTRMPIDLLLPLPPGTKEPPLHAQAKKIARRAHYWNIEALRRIASSPTVPNVAPKPPRRGYRSEVREWMQEHQIASVKAAAKRLGVSDSVLKSIMASKGKVKYSHETLESVLKKIGHGTSGDHS
jgi:hypothetical protein